MKSIITATLGVLMGFALLAGSASAASVPVSFTQYLGYGSQGPEVVKLQQFLIDSGFLHVYPTGNYLTLTTAAVKAYQSSQGISPTGYFGPLTLASANIFSNQLIARSTVSNVSVTAASDSVAGVFLANAKTIKWQTADYQSDAGVNVNLIKKVSDSPTSFELVRQLAVNSPNTGSLTWTPALSETSKDLYIEVTCSSGAFVNGCQILGSPIQAI